MTTATQPHSHAAAKAGRRLRAIDLCAGAGGWAVAARGLPVDIVLAVDWWEPACMTYRLNHPQTLVVRADLTQPPLEIARLRGKVDVVLGGIPCQWLSKYRNWAEHTTVKQAEIEQGRKLVDSILDICRRIEASYWCLEDVKGLIAELPPLTPWQEIQSAHYSGQRRKRVYVGEFPSPRRSRDPRKLADSVRPGPYRIGRRLYGREPVRSRTFGRDTCLAAEMHRKAPTVCNVTSQRDSELGVVDPRVPGGLRQMEWQEAATLQGYPPDYLFYGSPSDVGLMVANSVQIDTGRAILEAICAEAARTGQLEAA